MRASVAQRLKVLLSNQEVSCLILIMGALFPEQKREGAIDHVASLTASITGSHSARWIRIKLTGGKSARKASGGPAPGPPRCRRDAVGVAFENGKCENNGAEYGRRRDSEKQVPSAQKWNKKCIT
ncbi:hypothetical protein EVAR_92048_1 [Eumeta japonica]|uniref:Uncharacterized protein n=1 Tax=Eumeta variegata TaxID=151549 RepID=A0A4C1SYU3_EUMVA|nr:hypothetical protein EVAR_92048_1 [Eumeta japonica]